MKVSIQSALSSCTPSHIVALLCLASAAACGTASRTSPATPPRPVAAAPADTTRAAAPGGARTAATRRGYTEADVRFMHGMIAHHSQALAMTSLVPARSQRLDIQTLAERIEVSQRDEIKLMQNWLTSRGEKLFAADASGAHALMPGMLTTADLALLSGASGADFDRLFLQFMIRHHEGALQMVTNLLGTAGAAQESEIFRFAADVDANQRAEIARMRDFLDGMSGEKRVP